MESSLEELLGHSIEDELRLRLGAMGGRWLLDMAELRRVQEAFREVFILPSMSALLLDDDQIYTNLVVFIGKSPFAGKLEVSFK